MLSLIIFNNVTYLSEMQFFFLHSHFTRRFNATDFLTRLRGKRLMLVGDSMNRNQFESMLCLLREGLPDKSKMFEIHGNKITKGRGYYVFKFVVIIYFYIIILLQYFLYAVSIVYSSTKSII